MSLAVGTKPGLSPGDVASRLLEIERSLGERRSFARALARGRAGSRDSRALPTWRAAEEASRLVLSLDGDVLLRVLRTWIPNPKHLRFLLALWDGVRACAGEVTATRSGPRAVPAPPPEALLRGLRLERTFFHELRRRARAPLRLVVCGFGEVTRTVALERAASPFASVVPAPARVYKKLPPFPGVEMARAYAGTYREYNRRLLEAGLRIPDPGAGILVRGDGSAVIVCTQRRLQASSIAKDILLRSNESEASDLFGRVLEEIRKVFLYNRSQGSGGVVLGLDAQIPNWALENGAGRRTLWYLDTGTPMMRRGGRDCLPLSFYLQGLPGFARPWVRPLARRVLDRYFDLPTILLDFLANVAIHGRPDLVEPLLPQANGFLRECGYHPWSLEQVDRYRKRDVATWRLVRSLRQLDVWLSGRQSLRQATKNIAAIYRNPIF
ncbi:MAG: hypothetical protein KatS3mg076_2721 [Candidatus Binatia bacterium]|nr:MAG: hypothetical protein KatS3mg076_2721 [Candidatus Binatia bacterium]